MLRSTTSLPVRLRHLAALRQREAIELPGEALGASGQDLIQRKRRKVAIIAILVGALLAFFDVPLPLEDGFRAIRAQIRQRPAPQDIVVVGIDDETVRQLGGPWPSRIYDAQVLDNLFAAGVTRVVFDKAHRNLESPEADAAFRAALKRHSGKIWLGTAPRLNLIFSRSVERNPHKSFAEIANLAAMNGKGAPFSLSTTFPTFVQLQEKRYPSISSVLANYEGPNSWYRPDYAFKLSSLITLPYHDVLRNKIDKSELSGKSVVIGTSNLTGSDFYQLPFHGIVPGIYFHVLGAHTLKKGQPIDLLSIPALLLVSLVILVHVRGKRRSRLSFGLVAFGLVLSTFALDEFAISIDVVAALVALLVASIGFDKVAKKYLNSEADVMTTAALGLDRLHPDHDIYALKIANLSELSENWSAHDYGDFIAALISYVRGAGENRDIAFERDMLIWSAPSLSATTLERHADGLAMMIKAGIGHEWHAANAAPALGIDTNYDLPLGVRIKKAMQAAEEAVGQGVRFLINDPAHLEARNQRIDLIRLLEKGLRDRTIGVAYQPKVELHSGRIVGAETLIRWQPKGSGPINPQELVIAAEASDLINPLTILVLETALEDGKLAIARDPAFKLAINLSAKSLSDAGFLFEMIAMLGARRFPPANLVLEVTETAKLEDRSIAPQIEALRQRGITLSIDDFGTGRCNLEYIEKMPSAELKIDKHFIQQMTVSNESRAVVQATIEIAQTLGKVVVAEGVENEETAAGLLEMGCHHAQGYLYSPAILMPDLLKLMERATIQKIG